jgi:hypothetical protein
MFALLLCSFQAQFRDMRSDAWVATDGLGRAVYQGKDVAYPRPDRTVGIFYFLANHVPNGPIYDNTKIIAANPTNPQYGPYGAAHWWGEPWLGYYQSNDPTVIRKHMEMLSNAGVDVIVFDNTNGPTYPDVYLPLCQILETMRGQGIRTPQIAFFTGHGAWKTLEHDFYSRGLYRNLWFQWKGKPLMMVHLENGDTLPTGFRDEFSIRESWAWTPSAWFGDGRDKWPWLDNYPQNYGWHEDPKKPEEVAVTVGQHATSSIGRSSDHQHEPPVDDLRLTSKTPDGVCFAQQFERALKIDPEFIFITGWNEWTATRFRQEQPGIMAGKPEPAGGSFFVDEYNAEFSRDIEPAKGLLQDDYYYQMVSFIRRYKGARQDPPVSQKHIEISGSFNAWRSVQPVYLDATGDPVSRDNPGWGAERYTNRTGRNDIVEARVAYDHRNLYFYVKTAQPLTNSKDASWMLLFLNVGGGYSKGWLGYDFVADRAVGAKTTSLERNESGIYRWQLATHLRYRKNGSELMVEIPRSAVHLPASGGVIDFKWADNIQQTGDPSDFSLNGDSAPDDRFNYRAVIGP